MNILFVCNMNQQRSPTFEGVFRDQSDHNVKSAGILFGSETELSDDLLEWADKVYVMDLRQELDIVRNFNRFTYKVKTIGVSDEYPRDSPQLINLAVYWGVKEGLI